MQKPHGIIRPATRNVGDPSSKYGYDRTGEKFDRAIQENNERAEALWKDFVEFMLSHDIAPKELRWMFTRYYEEFLKG